MKEGFLESTLPKKASYQFKIQGTTYNIKYGGKSRINSAYQKSMHSFGS